MTFGIPKALVVQLEKCAASEITSVNVAGGGCISQAAIIIFADSNALFVKWNASAPIGFFGAEAAGLQELRASGVVLVPEVIAWNDTPESGPAYILMQVLLPGTQSCNTSVELGKQLAELHRCTSERYGLSRNNYIGAMVQVNSWCDTWAEFFFNNRLVKQAELGDENGWFDHNFSRLLVAKEGKIKDLLAQDSSPPSLLHGDLWSGNVYWTGEGPALIDPAVYYGSREADIAFTELFSGFDASFYHSYNEHYPLDKGYKKRKELLNLYHLMNHANLFGGSYISSAYSTLTRI